MKASHCFFWNSAPSCETGHTIWQPFGSSERAASQRWQQHMPELLTSSPSAGWRKAALTLSCPSCWTSCLTCLRQFPFKRSSHSYRRWSTPIQTSPCNSSDLAADTAKVILSFLAGQLRSLKKIFLRNGSFHASCSSSPKRCKRRLT